MVAKPKIVFVLIMMLAMIFVAIPVMAAAGDIQIRVNGKNASADVAPFMDASNRVIVPIRIVSEALGGEVGWNAKAQEVTIVGQGSKVVLKINSKTAVVDGKEVQMDTTAVMQAGRTMVPLRFVSENMGAKVAWDNQSWRVEIQSPLSAPPVIAHQVSGREQCSVCHKPAGALKEHLSRPNCLSCHVAPSPEIY